MGMHLGMVAVKADVAALVDAFTCVWPDYEPKADAQLSGLDALWNWMEANARKVSSRAWSPDNPSTDAFAFWQDGPWAVLFDADYTLAGDDAALAALSKRFGMALSFVIETSGGCAFFSAFRDGRRVRQLSYSNSTLTQEGERLPEEAGLPTMQFYMDEFEKLVAAFGLRTPYDMPEDAPVQGRAYVNRTDYSAQRAARVTAAGPATPPPSHGASAAPRPEAARPWWKFW